MMYCRTTFLQPHCSYGFSPDPEEALEIPKIFTVFKPEEQQHFSFKAAVDQSVTIFVF
jgi:hypothetical protein